MDNSVQGGQAVMAGGAIFIDRTHGHPFVDDAELKRYLEYHNNPSATFKVHHGSAIMPVCKHVVKTKHKEPLDVPFDKDGNRLDRE